MDVSPFWKTLRLKKQGHAHSHPLPLPPPLHSLSPTFRIVDVNQSLVDDGLVDKEKIGGSNFFWSFPAKADRKLQLEHRATLERIETLRSELAQAKHRLDDARRGREDDEADVEVNAVEMEEVPPDTTVDDEAGTAAGEKRAASTITAAPSSLSRATKLQRLEELRVQRVQVERELAVLRENDPQALADLEKELQLVTEAAHRWTDNIFNCKSYLVKKRGMDRKEAEKLLGITSAFDCA